MPGFPGAMAGQGPGGANSDNGPADTRTPAGAVRAFLRALQAKDRDLLAEATALRSQTEAATTKNQELFAKIVDMSISDSELDDLSKRMEGYHVAGENAVKSTGRQGVFIEKSNDRGDVSRVTLTVRKEKKGWGVMDISGSFGFKGMGGQNQQRRTGARN
jgi:hypothetical protein